MRAPDCVLAVDVGTTSAKTCLYELGPRLRLRASAQVGYPLRVLGNGGVEQDPEDWWRAAARGAREALAAAGLPSGAVRGIAFCCQMQGLVLVDGKGQPVRPAMSYLDQRGAAEKAAGLEFGLRIEGMEIRRLLASLSIAGGISASVKDPLWKYHWVRNHEPEAFARARTWLDVKEYLVLRATGRTAMTPDSANATFLYDTRPGRGGWSRELCGLFGVDPAVLPELVGAAEEVGPLSSEGADFLGLSPGTPVFGGGGDLSLIALGSGAVEPGRAHVYMGTSGWVAASTERRLVDARARCASVLGAIPGRYNFISEQETSGKCMEWVRDHLAQDEIGLYLGRAGLAGEPESAEVFELLDATVAAVPPGANGVLFAPWLHGSRSPFEDPNARGIFFNLGIETGKRSLVRAVAEGLALQCRWQFEALSRSLRPEGALRFVGGVARSAAIGQILADVLGRRVEVPEEPQNAGALGAALTAAAGLGAVPSLAEAAGLVRAVRTYEPEPGRGELYAGRLAALKKLYDSTKGLFAELNRLAG